MARPAQPTLVISDANVLMDLMAGDLLEPLFALGWRVLVPDVLLARELKDEAARLKELGLLARSVRSAGVQLAVRLATDPANTGVGRLDLLALALAKQEGGVLLTGDAKLRALAVREEQAVHGTLWTVGAMLEQGRIRVARATRAYEAMRGAGRRLPWDEVRRQLQRHQQEE